jgi:nickel transport protein
MRHRITALLALGAVALATSAGAHTAWLEPDGRPGVWKLMFGGHQGRTEPVVPSKLKAVTAFDARGRALRVTRTVKGADVRLAVAGAPAVIALHYDNGIHTRTAKPGPSIERPMNEVEGAVSATNALKYGKTVVRWSPAATRPVSQPFEVIPMSADQPRAGQPMRVQVRMDGRPAPGVRIGPGEDTAQAVTDASGIASFTPVAGANKLWAGKRIETRTEPRYTQLSYEYLLSFDAR